MLNFAAILLVLISAFFATFAITPFIIRRMKKRGFVGKDMNKHGFPKISEMGGISVIMGFSLALTIAIFLHSYLGAFESMSLTLLLAGFITIILVGVLGIIDDLIGWRNGIRQWQHALVPMFAALPLMALNVGTTFVALPFFGKVNLGLFYSLIFVPIGVTGASNAANMLAGLNGLEAGLGIINVFTILAIALITGKIEAIIIMAAMLGALIAFIKFNWFPAKIFPGDSLTLMIGAGIATAVIIGDMEKIGILLFGIYFVELAIKAKHKFQSQCFGIPQKNGTLKPNPAGGSITHWIMRRGQFTEKQVTLIILGIQSIIAVIVFLLSILKMF